MRAVDNLLGNVLPMPIAVSGYVFDAVVPIT